MFEANLGWVTKQQTNEKKNHNKLILLFLLHKTNNHRKFRNTKSAISSSFARSL